MCESNSIDLWCTIILAISSVVSIAITLYFTAKRRSEFIEQNWFRFSINYKNIEEFEKMFDELTCVLLSDKSQRPIKLISFKKTFNKIRYFFSKITFFDETMKNKVDNFLYSCENECMINEELSKEDIEAMKNIILKSFYEYEKNNYKDFNIKY